MENIFIILGLVPVYKTKIFSFSLIVFFHREVTFKSQPPSSSSVSIKGLVSMILLKDELFPGHWFSFGFSKYELFPGYWFSFGFSKDEDFEIVEYPKSNWLTAQETTEWVFINLNY